MTTVILSIVSVIAVSLVSLVGFVAISTRARVRKLATLFVSFAVGALQGDALIQLIPETFAGPVPITLAIVVIGLLTFIE